MVNDMAVKMLSFEETKRIVEESNTESEEEKSDMSSLFTNKLLLPLHSQAQDQIADEVFSYQGSFEKTSFQERRVSLNDILAQHCSQAEFYITLPNAHNSDYDEIQIKVLKLEVVHFERTENNHQ